MLAASSLTMLDIASWTTQLAARMSAVKGCQRLHACPHGCIRSQVEVARYRPNILVGGANVEPFAEDAWQAVELGPHRLLVDGAHATSQQQGSRQGDG
jgi:uncharacterized protein YcbX